MSEENPKLFYTPDDLQNLSYQKDLGNPGQYPYTRGIHETGYKGKLWTMRQFAGFGTAEETNKRFKYLLEKGQTGLSTAFDVPTLYGKDTGEEDVYEFGEGGVACNSIADMEILYADIPLDQVSVSMTINGPAAAIWAMFLASADNRGYKMQSLRGTLQNDILKEFIAQNEQIFPISPSLRLVVDSIEYSIKEVPNFNPISVSGYHIRETGSTAVQELAFTLVDGFTYIEECLKRGLDVNKVGSKMSFFFNSHNNFFEEIAKFRAARRIWAKTMKEKYGATDEKAWKLRTHAQTAGCTLYQNNVDTNVSRAAYQAMAAVLGGTNSLHVDAKDEAESLPSDAAAKTALRTQQVLAFETGVADVADPLGGSFYVESLTDQIEKEAREYFKKITGLGGMVEAIKKGFPQTEIISSAIQYQQEIDSGQIVVVGVNKFQDERDLPPQINKDPEGLKRQLDRLAKLRLQRDNQKVKNTLADLKKACANKENVMPYLIEAAKAHVTLGEMTKAMKEVFGEAQRPD